MATPASSAGAAAGEGSAKARVAEYISQAVQSTSNLLHLMQQSSPSQFSVKVGRCVVKNIRWLSVRFPLQVTASEQEALITSLPKNLMAKISVIKNTEQVLEQMPQVISSLDAYMEQGLRSAPHLGTVIQLLSNMEGGQVKATIQNHQLPEEPVLTTEPVKDD